MKRIFLLMAFLVAGMATAQITNIDKLRLNDIEEKIANDMVLTVDATGLVAWKNQDEITPDLSAYYTKSEIDTLLESISYNDLLNAPTNLSDFNNDEGFITISDVPSYTGGDGIDITNNEIRVKQSVLDEINANTNKTLSDVTSKGNVTSIKIRGSSIFTNNLDADFAQIADVNKAGFGLISMQSEMKIGLVAKDGTTLLGDVDLSWLASGDLAITIDDTDANNPELVFSQGGVEVARIPASTLLSGVARSANLSNYILQFKDGTGAVVYSVNLEPLFEDYFTKAEANARYLQLTGGTMGNTATIYWNGADYISGNIHKHRDVASGGLALGRMSNNTHDKGLGLSATGDFVFGDWSDIYSLSDSWNTVWHSGNLANGSTSQYIRGDGSLATIPTNHVTTSRSITAGTGLTGGGNLTEDRTLNFDTDWGDNRYGTKSFIGDAIDDIEIGGRNYLLDSGVARNSGNILFSEDFKNDTNKGEYTLSFNLHLENVTAMSQNKIGIEVNLTYSDGSNQWFNSWHYPTIGSSFKGKVYDTHLLPDKVITTSSISVYGGFVTADVKIMSDFKLERGTKATDWTPAPEDQVTDWDETNPDSYSFLKNKPTDLATQNWVNSQGFINDLSNYYTKTESLNQFVGLSGVQDIADTKTFLASPVVPNPTLDAHAVNKGWVEDIIDRAIILSTKLSSGTLGFSPQSPATKISFNENFDDIGVILEPNGDIKLPDGEAYYEIVISGYSGSDVNFGNIDFTLNYPNDSMLLRMDEGSINLFAVTGTFKSSSTGNTISLYYLSSDGEVSGLRISLSIKKL